MPMNEIVQIYNMLQVAKDLFSEIDPGITKKDEVGNWLIVEALELDHANVLVQAPWIFYEYGA